jgi:O-antigen/teichoic acid export membrane protein
VSEQQATRRRENVGTVMIVVATAASAIAVLAFQALGSRALLPEGFAPIAVLWTLMFLLFTVLMLPAEQHLTRALSVTREHDRIARVRRDMLGAFGLALVVGVGFVAATLDRFFEGDPWYLLITAGIVVSRSLMATARGSVAGHRRFSAYAATIGLEAAGLLAGGVAMYALGAPAVGFAAVMALAPLLSLLVNPFSEVEGSGDVPDVEAQPGSFLVWLILATAASQLIIAGGPIAVSFIGGSAAAVSIFFTSFALLRGPVTSAYNLVARVLPDFTALAHGGDPRKLWRWGPRIVVGALGVAVVGALGAGLVLRPLIEVIYGPEFVPPQLAATLGGLGVGLGLGALFATQIFSAAAKGSALAFGWFVGLSAAILVLVLSGLDPVDRVALAFVFGEGTGLLMLGIVLPGIPRITRMADPAGARS